MTGYLFTTNLEVKHICPHTLPTHVQQEASRLSPVTTGLVPTHVWLAQDRDILHDLLAVFGEDAHGPQVLHIQLTHLEETTTYTTGLSTEMSLITAVRLTNTHHSIHQLEHTVSLQQLQHPVSLVSQHQLEHHESTPVGIVWVYTSWNTLWSCESIELYNLEHPVSLVSLHQLEHHEFTTVGTLWVYTSWNTLWVFNSWYTVYDFFVGSWDTLSLHQLEHPVSVHQSKHQVNLHQLEVGRPCMFTHIGSSGESNLLWLIKTGVLKRDSGLTRGQVWRYMFTYKAMPTTVHSSYYTRASSIP